MTPIGPPTPEAQETKYHYWQATAHRVRTTARPPKVGLPLCATHAKLHLSPALRPARLGSMIPPVVLTHLARRGSPPTLPWNPLLLWTAPDSDFQASADHPSNISLSYRLEHNATVLSARHPDAASNSVVPSPCPTSFVTAFLTARNHRHARSCFKTPLVPERQRYHTALPQLHCQHP